MDWNRFQKRFSPISQEHITIPLGTQRSPNSQPIPCFRAYTVQLHSVLFPFRSIPSSTHLRRAAYIFTIQYTIQSNIHLVRVLKLATIDYCFFFFIQFRPSDLNIFGLLALINFQKGNDESTADTIIINVFFF